MSQSPFGLDQEHGLNINQLTESEWRTIHNALSAYQCRPCGPIMRQQIQQLMDKVRDNYIAPTYDQTTPSNT